VELWHGRLLWITSDRHAPHRRDPLPLAVATGSCRWRQAGETALQGIGRRYRVAYSSATLAGTLAPVVAGLAVTIAPVAILPDGLRPLRADEGLPELPETAILLLKGREPRQPVTEVLAAHITETFGEEMRRQERG
jgi:DNA-binding transcriptional LysR family regulator